MTKSKENAARIQARNSRAREKEYKRKAKLLAKAGIYEPKGSELTEYRKRRINKEFTKFEQYIDDPRGKFFFVSAAKLDNKQRRKFLSNADQLNMVTTKKGVFLQKEGQRKARISYSKKRDEFDIVLTGKIKWGPNSGKGITQRIPVAPLDHLHNEEQRLRSMAESMGPLKKSDILSFVVYENGALTGAHRGTFDSVEGVMKRLNEYHHDNAAQKLAFFRLVIIQKSTILDWKRDHPTPYNQTARGRGKRGKRHPNER